MCIYLSFAAFYGSTKLRGIAITLQSQQECDWLPLLDKTRTSNSFRSFLIFWDPLQVSVFPTPICGPLVCLWAVPSSGESRSLFWCSNTVLPSSSRITSSAPSVWDISSLQLLLPGEKCLTGVISLFDKHIIATSRNLGVIV